LQLVFSR